MSLQHELNGEGNAQRFLKLFEDTICYVPELKSWQLYKDSHWETDNELRIREMAKKAVKDIRQEVFSGNLSNEEAQQAYSFYNRCLTKTGINEILEMAKSLPQLVASARRFDRDPMILNLRNGTYDLKSGILNKHNPGDLLTLRMNASYNPEAKAPRFRQFLLEVFSGDQSKVDYMQMFLGYCLTGCVDEEFFQFWYGGGSNGKSTLAETLLDVWGTYGQKTGGSLFFTDLSADKPAPQILKLKGARMVIASELPEGRSLCENTVKDIVSRDSITCRTLYSEPVTFSPSHKIAVFGNHKPPIRGTDDGVWRRIHLIPYEASFTGKNIDKNLGRKLRDERDGILNFAIRGFEMWSEKGLAPPSSIASASNDYRQECDVIGRFLEERCEIGGTGKTPKGEVFSAYKEWCEQNNEFLVTSRLFGSRLKDKKIGESKSGSVRFWKGLVMLGEETYDAPSEAQQYKARSKKLFSDLAGRN